MYEVLILNARPYVIEEQHDTPSAIAIMHSRQKYKLLGQRSSRASQDDVESDDGAAFSAQELALTRAKKIIYALIFILGVTTVSAALLLTRQRCSLTSPSFCKKYQCSAIFENKRLTPLRPVDLEANVPVPISHDDHTIEDPMWDSPEYDWYLGWVALQNDVAKSKGLPTAMHWPWDSSRSIYILHGFHSLHCVVSHSRSSSCQSASNIDNACSSCCATS